MYPRTIFADKNGPWRQVAHLAGEVWEVIKALAARDYRHAAQELADVQHSAETLLYILRDRHGVDMDGAKNAIILKNYRRGYYGRR